MSKRARFETPEPEVKPSKILWEILNNLSIQLWAYEEAESVFIKEKREQLSKLFENIKLAINRYPEDHQTFSYDYQMNAIDFATKLLQTTIKVREITPDSSNDSPLNKLKLSQQNRERNDESKFRFSKRVNNSLDLCLICHEEFKSSQSISEFPCYENHEFHTSCVKVLLRTSFRCPICSTSLDEIAQ
ncbi:hypothetical protein DFH28DRAFT_1094587 [Melampsora americana]|nr:hypothetical protein DFH28DRAFT_1094587 [Melampsora americana]